MVTVEIKDVEGNEAGSADLSSDVYGIEPNIPVMHQVVRAQRASWRQGTSNTRTRGNVRGGGHKPWRQKGTGRARQGSTRSPQWRGGGTVFGPHPRSYAMKINKKEIKYAMRSALSAKLADEQLMVIKDLTFEAPRTKDAVAALKALDLDDRRVTIIVPDDDVNTILSFRNLQKVRILPVSCINTYDFLDNKVLVISESCLGRIEEVLG